MTKTLFTHDPVTNEWIHGPSGRRLPVVSGGDPTANPNEVILSNEPATIPPNAVDPAPNAVDQVPVSQNSRMFSEEEVENIRRQEKEKVYGRIDKLQTQLELFNSERDEAKKKADEATERESAERKAREEEELSAKELLNKREDEFNQRLNTAQSEWEEKFVALQQQSEAQQALLEHERQFQALETYKNRRIQEESENIMPELVGFITGNTEEEIESSISAVADRTSAIMTSMQEALPAQPERPRGIQPTGQTPNGPMENATEHQTITADDIAKMDMSTFAANRERLLAAASNMRRG